MMSPRRAAADSGTSVVSTRLDTLASVAIVPGHAPRKVKPVPRGRNRMRQTPGKLSYFVRRPVKVGSLKRRVGTGLGACRP